MPRKRTSLLSEILKGTEAEKGHIEELTKPPDLSKDYKTSFTKSGYYQPNDYVQMDLLFLPGDMSFEERDIKSHKFVSKTKKGKPADYLGYRYLLVAVDIGTRKTVAVPLLSKEGGEVLLATKTVFNSKKKHHLKRPKAVMVDAGSEFSEAIKWFKNQKPKVGIRVAETARHSQQAAVEAMNKTIGRGITQLLSHNETISGELETNWLQFLPDILTAINSNLRSKKQIPQIANRELEEDKFDVKCGVKKKTKMKVKKNGKMVSKWVVTSQNDSECDVYNVGDKVRVALNAPKDIEGNKLIGSFRSGDVRWSLNPHTIENVLILPRQPIRYKVTGRDRNTYSKGQLKPYKKGNVTPVGKMMERTDGIVPEGQFLVEKFVDFKEEKTTPKGRKVKKWLVKWKGYPASRNDWVLQTQLKMDLKKEFNRFVEQYNRGE